MKINHPYVHLLHKRSLKRTHMKLSIGFSPCPNDTFIFDAMIHGKINTEGLEFDVKMADVEELNKMAFAYELDITKLSFHAFAYLLSHYVLLDSGSALGNGCGPLLISKNELNEKAINNGSIAIPGKYTTANFLLSLAYPAAKNKKEYLFSEIESAVINDTVNAGLIIHENRFTYQQKGLKKIVDLGEFWENTTGHPIPLGGIVVQRKWDMATRAKVNRVLKRSIEYAFNNPESPLNFIKQHAQEMDKKVMYSHINLYVNDYSLDLGTKGRAAVTHLFDMAHQKEILPQQDYSIFWDEV